MFKIPSYNVFWSLSVSVFLRHFVEGLRFALNFGSVCTTTGRHGGGDGGGGGAAAAVAADDDNNDNFEYSNK